MEQVTLAIIKPNTVKAGYTGRIIEKIEKAGFVITNIMRAHLTEKDSGNFYAIHKDRPFFQELVDYISSGPVIVMTLLKENAIEDFRKFIGATNPENAEVGTLRREFGTSISDNAIHGSDSPENALQEEAFFFGTSGQNCCGGNCC